MSKEEFNPGKKPDLQLVETPKTISQWREASPNFSKLCFEDEQMTIALQFASGWTHFFLTYLMRDLTPAGRFFTETRGHQMFYYTLLKTMIDAVLYRQSDQIGLHYSDAMREILSTRCGTTKAREIINDSVENGYVVRTFWRQDSRKKVFYLETTMVESWFEYCAITMFDSVTEGHMADIRPIIEDSEGQFFADIIEKIKTAKEKDLQLKI